MKVRSGAMKVLGSLSKSHPEDQCQGVQRSWWMEALSMEFEAEILGQDRELKQLSIGGGIIQIRARMKKLQGKHRGECMTRSNSSGNLVELSVEELARVERENRRRLRERRDQERLDHLHRLGMEGQRVEEDPRININRNERRGDNEDREPFIGPRNNGNRPIGAFDEPNAREVTLGIMPPTFQNNTFEIKGSMLNMVERSTFKGNPIECPLEHLDRFERLCRTIKMNGVPEDAIKMMLFPFSLDDKGAYWERNIPSTQVSTWNDVKTEFLRKFFPKQKTAKFRSEIQGFRQKGDESLCEAWDRLKGLTRSCPHHGVSKENLLGIFYRGVHNEIRRALDTASYGSFSSLDCAQAETLIENLAQSDACFGGDYDRTLRVTPTTDDRKFKEINEKLDMMNRVILGNKRQVSFVGDLDGDQDSHLEGTEATQEEAYYLNNQNEYRPFNSTHPNLSYRSNNVENPQDQVYPQARPQGQFQRPFAPRGAPNQGQSFQQSRPQYQQGYFPKPNHYSNQGGSSSGTTLDDLKTMLKTLSDVQIKITQENSKAINDLKVRMIDDTDRLSARMDGLEAMAKSIELERANGASSSQRPSGSFPGKPEANPRGKCNVVMLGEIEEEEETEVEISQETKVEYGKETTKKEDAKETKRNPILERYFYDFIGKDFPEKEEARNDDEKQYQEFIDGLNIMLKFNAFKIDEDTTTSDQEIKDEESRLQSKEHVEMVNEIEECIKENEGFSFKNKGKETVKEEACKVDTIASDVIAQKEDSSKEELPSLKNQVEEDRETKNLVLASFQREAPCLDEKDMKTRRLLVELNERVDLIARSLLPSHVVTNSPIFNKAMRDALGNYKPKYELPRVLPKQEHPGSFVIPCTINHFILEDALCDSGACVNIISLEMVKSLGLGPMSHCSLPIMFGDASVRKPEGILVDYPIVVDGCIIPSDMIVLNMVDERRQPLILGGPFLASVGAKMDYESMTVVLSKISRTTFYQIEPRYSSVVRMVQEISPSSSDEAIKVLASVKKVEMDELGIKNNEIVLFASDEGGEPPDAMNKGIKDENAKVELSVIDQGMKCKTVPIEGNVKEKDKEPPGVVIKEDEPKNTKIKEGVKKKSVIPLGCSIKEIFPKITLKPLSLIENTLECKVVCKGGPKPFHKAKFSIPKELKGEEFYQAKSNMEKLFEFEVKEWKPFDESGASSIKD